MKIGNYNETIRIGDRVKIVRCNDGCDFCGGNSGINGEVTNIRTETSGKKRYILYDDEMTEYGVFRQHLLKLSG